MHIPTESLRSAVRRTAKVRLHCSTQDSARLHYFEKPLSHSRTHLSM